MEKEQEEEMKRGFSKIWETSPEGKLPYFDLGSICERFYSFGYETCLSVNRIEANKEKLFTPRQGQAVFFYEENRNAVSICRITRTPTEQYEIKDQNGRIVITGYETLKPFDASKIGKSWNEI